MDNKTLTESMSAMKEKLQLIESATTNEATTGAAEKAAEKFGIGTAKSALRNVAQKAREKLAAAKNKVAPAASKVEPAASKVATASDKESANLTKLGLEPIDRSAMSAEQKVASEYYSKNALKSSDGKIYARDPKNVGEFLELDAKTMLPKGQTGNPGFLAHEPGVPTSNSVRSADDAAAISANYASGTVSRELQALEKLGPQEVKALETKALNSALTDAEKAEVKSVGIINWIKNNPGKAKTLGLLAAVAATGVAVSSMMGGEEEPTIAPKPSDNTTTQVTPEQAEQKILAIIKELEAEPACAEDVAKIKAELARIKGGQVAPAPAAAPAAAPAPAPAAAPAPATTQSGVTVSNWNESVDQSDAELHRWLKIARG